MRTGNHGIGTGKLSCAVKEFLKIHPSVKSFTDEPQHLEGVEQRLYICSKIMVILEKKAFCV
ncbi:MAG: Smr/MutS family protein [Sulfuricurvum sp.]